MQFINVAEKTANAVATWPSQTTKRRVVVTGVGAVTPLGHTMINTWSGITEGVSVGDKIKRFDASLFPTAIGYEVRDFSFQNDLISQHEAALMNDAARYGVTAAAEALEQAGLAALKNRSVNSNRFGVCLGVGMCSPDFNWYEKMFMTKCFHDEIMREHLQFFPDQLSSVVARMAGAKGGISTIHTACASSGQSLGEAFEQVAYGDCDVVLTGGADSMISPYYFAGFSLLGALSKRNNDPKTASRPFDAARDGFVLGEGACMLVFEEYEHAVQRGAKILGEVCGYGITESAYRITDLHPEGHGPMEAMQMAVDDAGINAEQVAYVNAHGTSTPLNDRLEGLAISKIFPKERCSTQVSSSKSMTGHMISAAGAIEFAVCLKALDHQVLPPSVNVFEQDSECFVTLTASVPKELCFDYALSNSVGFGGSNTALVAGSVRQINSPEHTTVKIGGVYARR
jgi:3-oxoacyl-[acyl-carrier-protein] synthase II